jgi:hypothetical protein
MAAGDGAVLGRGSAFAGSSASELECATVVAATAEALGLALGHSTVPARRAASCLLEPDVGDRVLVARVEGAAWVLAVLERANPAAPARVSTGASMELRAPDGRIALAAQEGIDLVTARDLRAVAGGLDVSAGDATMALDRLTFLAETVRAEIERVRLATSRIHTDADEVSLHTKRSFRRVEEHDQVRSGSIDYAAQKLAQVTARTLLVTADDLVKLDGEQVHVG